jgi:hypothetical protein
MEAPVAPTWSAPTEPGIGSCFLFHGEHPTLLASGISEMLTNLRAHYISPAYTLTIKRGPKDPSFLIIILTNIEEVVGCVRILKNYEPYS